MVKMTLLLLLIWLIHCGRERKSFRIIFEASGAVGRDDQIDFSWSSLFSSPSLNLFPFFLSVVSCVRQIDVEDIDCPLLALLPLLPLLPLLLLVLFLLFYFFRLLLLLLFAGSVVSSPFHRIYWAVLSILCHRVAIEWRATVTDVVLLHLPHCNSLPIQLPTKVESWTLQRSTLQPLFDELNFVFF